MIDLIALLIREWHHDWAEIKKASLKTSQRPDSVACNVVRWASKCYGAYQLGNEGFSLQGTAKLLGGTAGNFGNVVGSKAWGKIDVPQYQSLAKTAAAADNELSSLGKSFDAGWEALPDAKKLGTGFDDVLPDSRLVSQIDVFNQKITGARILSKFDPDDWDAAEDYYRVIRNMSVDIDEIVLNSRLSRSVVERVKNHIFNKLHLLDDGLRRFDADPDIVNTWQRLRAGNGIMADFQLFKHEHAESVFEQLYGGTYRRAHDSVTRRWPSGL